MDDGNGRPPQSLDCDLCRPIAIFLERGVLIGAWAVSVDQLVDDGVSQHTLPLAVYEDDFLPFLMAVLLHDSPEMVKLVVQDVGR